MNSERFVLQNSFEANYLNVSLDGNDELDEIAVKVIQKDCPDFLVPFHLVSVNEQLSLRYKMINAVALAYADMTVPKAVFAELYLNLLEPFIKGKDWFLDYHHLCVEPRYVYIDKHTYHTFYLYLPISGMESTDQEIFEFFKNIFMGIMISDDKDFQVRLFRLFGSGSLTLEGLYQFIVKERGSVSAKAKTAPFETQQPRMIQPQSIQPQIMQPQMMQPGIMQPQPARRTEESASAQRGGSETSGRQPAAFNPPVMPRPDVSSGESGDDEVVQALFGDKKAKKEKPDKKAAAQSQKSKKDPAGKKQTEKGHGKLGGLFGGKKKQEEKEIGELAGGEPESTVGAGYVNPVPAMAASPQNPAYVPMYGAGDSDSDETEIISDDMGYSEGPWLELLDYSQLGAMQRIDLNFAKPFITIGRLSSDETRPDVAFPAEFKRIGRQHARIERRGNDLFLIDLGSANHTMLNGQILAPNQPYQLQNGMELAFTVNQPLRYRVHI